MTVKAGQGKRSAAEADAAGVPRSAFKEKPQDAAAREWMERLAALPDQPPVDLEDALPERAGEEAGAAAADAPPANPRRRAVIGAAVAGGLILVSHFMQQAPSAPSAAPDPPSLPASALPPRVTATGAAATPSGVVILDNGNSAIRYDSIPYDWTPDLAALTVNNPGDFYGSVVHPKTGFLSEFNIVHFDAHTDLGSIDGHRDAIRYQLEKDYAAIVLQKAAVLTCGYATGQDVGRNRFYKYWYRFRPAQADPDHARGVAADNPLLKIASPRNDCPPNKLQAQWASDVPAPAPYDFNRDVPGSPSWDPHKGVWH